MSGYTKLFNSIVTSTIWTEDDKTRIVWITMLALADKHGEVQASIPGLARVAGVSVADCEKALEKFLSPDPYSRTPDDEGRRIESIEGGWVLLNHGKYRDLASKEESKASNAVRQKRWRDRQRRNAKVTGSDAGVTEERDIADAKAEAKSTPKPPRGASPLDLPHGKIFREAWATWVKHRGEIKKSLKPTQTASQLKTLGKMPEAEAVAMIEHTVAMGWQGLRQPDPAKSGGNTPVTTKTLPDL